MMRKSKKQLWGEVREATYDADSIAYDGCHKIYISMDKKQTKVLRDHYLVLTAKELSPEDMFENLEMWHRCSCGLEFIQSMATDKKSGETNFATLIPQGRG
jgi:hypothetical protein